VFYESHNTSSACTPGHLCGVTVIAIDASWLSALSGDPYRASTAACCPVCLLATKRQRRWRYQDDITLRRAGAFCHAWSVTLQRPSCGRGKQRWNQVPQKDLTRLKRDAERVEEIIRNGRGIRFPALGSVVNFHLRPGRSHSRKQIWFILWISESR